MAVHYKPTEHLTDLRIRFQKVIFAMTDYTDRASLRAAIFVKRFDGVDSDLEDDELNKRLDKDFRGLKSEPDFSNMIRNRDAHLTVQQIQWLCDTLMIEPESFLDSNIQSLIFALAESAEPQGWPDVDPEIILSHLAELQLIDPSLDPRPGFVPTFFATHTPELLMATNHSQTKVNRESLARPQHRKILLDNAKKFEPFSHLKRPKLTIERLQVAASSDVYELNGHGNSYLLKVVRRLDEEDLRLVQAYENFFADAQVDNAGLFQDAECLRPIRASETGSGYLILDPDKSTELGLSPRDHYLTLQPFASDKVMFGEETIPMEDLELVWLSSI